MILLLLSWQEITRVLSRTMYINDNDYEQNLIEFKLNIIKFKQGAEKTIYASQSGDDINSIRENFYCHVLT